MAVLLVPHQTWLLEIPLTEVLVVILSYLDILLRVVVMVEFLATPTMI